MPRRSQTIAYRLFGASGNFLQRKNAPHLLRANANVGAGSSGAVRG
jgi:hypothetical protein